MNESTPASMTPATPWHLWLVGVLALLWNCMGALDFTMTQTQNAAYLSGLSPEQLAYIHGFPLWAIAFWALGVWGGVLGAVLLLLRQRWAVPVFAASLVGAVITPIYNFVLTDGAAIMGGGVGSLIFAAVIAAIAAGLLLFARGLARSGVLR